MCVCLDLVAEMVLSCYFFGFINLLRNTFFYCAYRYFTCLISLSNSCSPKFSGKYNLNLLQCGILPAKLKVWEGHQLEVNCLPQWRMCIQHPPMICLVWTTKKNQIWRWVHCEMNMFGSSVISTCTEDWTLIVGWLTLTFCYSFIILPLVCTPPQEHLYE